MEAMKKRKEHESGGEFGRAGSQHSARVYGLVRDVRTSALPMSFL